MIRQLPDRVKMGALLMPLVGDTSTPWALDACCGFVCPWMRRIALERGWHLVVGDIAPMTNEVVKMDLNGRLPWEDRQFEYVCCIDTLEHVENTDNAIKELARVTRSGGYLVVGVPIVGKYPNMRLLTKPILDNGEGHGHLWAFGLDLADRIIAAGFKHVGGVYSHDDTIFRLAHLWIMERI
jgi:SAM-dependent methyltransferase